jgi:hypothetical protein
VTTDAVNSALGVSPASKVADNGINVKRHAALGDDQAVAAVFKEKPACGGTGAGHARAARIEGADTADEPIGGVVGVAADDHVGAASGQHRSELLIGDAWVDPRPVVGKRRRVDAEDRRTAADLKA